MLSASAECRVLSTEYWVMNDELSRSAEEMTSNEGKEKLKKEILEKVNEYLPEEGAEDVFFTDFVVQF